MAMTTQTTTLTKPPEQPEPDQYASAEKTESHRFSNDSETQPESQRTQLITEQTQNTVSINVPTAQIPEPPKQTDSAMSDAPWRKVSAMTGTAVLPLDPNGVSRRKQAKEDKAAKARRRLVPPLLKRSQFMIVSGGSDRLHKKECMEQHRKKGVKKPRVNKLKPEKFLEEVDAYKENKNVIVCVCEPDSFNGFRTVKFYVLQTWKQFASCIGTFCCPPLPTSCSGKIAFWPPNRGYFFVHYDPRLTWSPYLINHHKITKANRIIKIEENYSLGLEHSCCDRIQDISVFVIQNSHKQYIAGFVAKPRSKRIVKKWIVYSHPNGSDLSDLMTLMPSPVQMADYLNCNIVTYDYPGYGISTGKPKENNFYDTIDAILEYVTKTLEVPIKNVVLWGYSIGTVCSVHAAMLHDVAGIVLLAPVASILRTLKSTTCFDRGNPIDYPTSCADSFASIDMITRVKCPIFIAHGELDSLIPIAHGKTLYEQAKKTNEHVYALWIPDVGHNNVCNSSEIWQRFHYFLDTEITNATELKDSEDSNPSKTKSRSQESQSQSMPGKRAEKRKRRKSQNHAPALEAASTLSKNESDKKLK